MDRTTTINRHEFSEKGHVHKLDGKRLTGTTTVLGVIAKPFLIQWAADMACDSILEKAKGQTHPVISIEELEAWLGEARVAHTKKKEKAGDWGTQTHALVEAYIKGMIERYDGEANHHKAKYLAPENRETNPIAKFMDWSRENNVKFLASEKLVHSEKWWVGGICDILCEIDGKRYVGDIKTGKRIYPEAFIQCAAYAKMLEEMGEPKVEGTIVINLKKDGGFDVQQNFDLEGNIKCFEAALTIYRQMEAITK